MTARGAVKTRPRKKAGTKKAPAARKKSGSNHRKSRPKKKTAPKPARLTQARRKDPLVIIDNYDSFTYNLVQYLGSLGAAIEVFRNDEVSPAKLQKLKPRGIVISPGPGTPEDGGISVDVVRKFTGKIPILGVCLGHQAIAAAFGGRVIRSSQVMHGKTSRIIHDGGGIFRGLENPFVATRYHSLVVERESLPETLEVTCSTSDAVIMGLKVRGEDTWGVQFHPESILTKQGKDLLRNFLDLCSL